jgi:hypothetical protein
MLPKTIVLTMITSATLLPHPSSAAQAITIGASRTGFDAFPRPRANSCATFQVPVLSFQTSR